MTDTLVEETTPAPAPVVDVQPVEHTNLFLALLAFQKEMPTVPKTKTARVPTKSGGQYTYTYADLAVVSAAATPLLAKHGLVFVATPAPGPHGYELVGRIIHAATTAEVTGSLPLFGTSSQDIGGSITYMRRYLMGCLTGIITDDDTDAAEAPAQRAKQQDPRKPSPEKLTPAQIDDLRDWGKSGHDVDAIVFRLFGLRGDLPDVMTREQGDLTLNYLRENE
jgi:hypothetical protein